MQRDVDYSVCKGDKKFKNKADRKMVRFKMWFVGMNANGLISEKCN